MLRERDLWVLPQPGRELTTTGLGSPFEKAQKNEIAPPRLAFDISLEQGTYKDLELALGKQQAREMMVRWMFYQLQAFTAEALRVPVSYRQDLEVTKDDGSREILALGGEWTDVREMTLKAVRKFPEDPRIRADHYGWTRLYNELEDMPNGSVGFLVSPGPEYDLVYLLQVGDQDTPHTRRIDKLMIIVKQDLEVYGRMINFCQQLKRGENGSLPLYPDPKLEAIQRDLTPAGEINTAKLYPHELLYFPQVLGPRNLAEFWKQLKETAGVAEQEQLPKVKDIDQALGKETIRQLASYERQIRQVALRVGVGLASGEMSVREAQTLVDNLVRQAVRTQYQARGEPMPREIKICGGKLNLNDDEMLEERTTATGETEYKCPGCGHWVTLDLGYCPYCAYRFKCGGRNTKETKEEPKFEKKVASEMDRKASPADNQSLAEFFVWLLSKLF